MKECDSLHSFDARNKSIRMGDIILHESLWSNNRLSTPRLDENFHIDNQTIRKTNDNFGNSLMFQPAIVLHFYPRNKELRRLLESRPLHERQPRGGSYLQCQSRCTD
jgi:hypothetical protein